MLVFDNIKEIAYQSDYNTIIALFDSYPQLYKDFWRNLCKIKYPDEPFVDFLSGSENYLRKNKQFYITFNIQYCRPGYSRNIYEKSSLPKTN